MRLESVCVARCRNEQKMAHFIEYNADAIKITLSSPATVEFFKAHRDDREFAQYIVRHFDEWVAEMDVFVKNLKTQQEKSIKKIRWFEKYQGS